MKPVEQLIRGAIDFHVHADPDPFSERRLDALELASEAKKAGMKAVVMKCHQYGTAPIACIVNKVIPDFTLIGSLVLNKEAGGLNPDIVEVAAKLGAKVIWMPTQSSVPDAMIKRKEGISVIDQNGAIIPAMIQILQIIKNYDMILGTGHASKPEIYAVTDEAKRLGIKVTITHPITSPKSGPFTIEEQKELAGKGAYLEYCFVSCMPFQGGQSPAVIVEHVKAVGAEHCILSTDLGQAFNPSPPEGFRMMIANMLKFGVSEKELEVMVKANPAKILGLT